jgi:hypothetical protein
LNHERHERSRKKDRDKEMVMDDAKKVSRQSEDNKTREADEVRS